MIEEITIKFGTRLKPTQHSWKSQLYNSYYKKIAFISSRALEHETLEKPCRHGPKNISTNSESTYIDRLRGVKVCITIH